MRALFSFMRNRRHHNNIGFQQIKSGAAERALKKIAKKLGIKYGDVERIDRVSIEEYMVEYKNNTLQNFRIPHESR